jgi:hypothetical protein
LLKSGDTGELTDIVEHDAEVVVEGGEVFDGFIFLVLLLLFFLLGLDSEVVLFGEGVVV